jgi:hypothetical protein
MSGGRQMILPDKNSQYFVRVTTGWEKKMIFIYPAFVLLSASLRRTLQLYRSFQNIF